MDCESKRVAREVLWYGRAQVTQVVYGPIVPFMRSDGPAWVHFERTCTELLTGIPGEAAIDGFRVPYP